MGKTDVPSVLLLPLLLLHLGASWVNADSLSAPLNVTIRALKVNSAVVTWDILDGDPVIGFAITQQKKDVRMLRFIQEVNTTTRSCALWDLEEDTEYIVHVQSISMRGTSPPSDPVLFRTPREAEKLASKSPGKLWISGFYKSACLYLISLGFSTVGFGDTSRVGLHACDKWVLCLQPRMGSHRVIL
ncbi:fibronectin type III domain-containing protein 5b isoform X3 [Paramormyrops kingsleyae]|uniref:fibronectin type III domain-containing protein 5b isoform X3 n=1 Tax=Paramormyrops kingsleyae TaxID=1676925 RepID=UPI000CD61987|nr:fibronectin type III domain-containing protein 5 isoform X3 [Paramormyrops kingsleyae]